ncbi:MAG: CHAD domain-containing protein, partial [Mesorhizobium sp.]
KLLRKLLKRSEKSLTKACLADATELFGDSPKRSAKRLARKARDDLAPQEEAKAA